MPSGNLYVLVTKEHAYTFRHHLETWGRSLRQYVRTIFYDELPHYRWLHPGTYLFTDLERLTDAQLELAAATADQLQAATARAPVRVFNHPRSVLRRAALLKTLHEKGVNPFRVFRIGDDLATARYPLFIRRDNEHDGSVSPLIHTPADLPAALAAARTRGLPDADLLIVEHCDTADTAGIYRKYAAFVIGERVFPFHINFARQWVVKRTEHLTPELEAEEMAFRASITLLPQLRQVFDLAHVQYGRMDFALKGDRLLVWEINTNPTLGGDPAKAKPHRLPLIQAMLHDVNEGLSALRPSSDPGASDRVTDAPIPLAFPTPLLRRLGITPTRILARRATRALHYLADNGVGRLAG